MGVRLKRNLGLPRALDAGQYTVETTSGRPAISCPGCATTVELERTYRIECGGAVTPVWQCGTEACSFRDWITLCDHDEDVLR